MDTRTLCILWSLTLPARWDESPCKALNDRKQVIVHNHKTSEFRIFWYFFQKKLPHDIINNKSNEVNKNYALNDSLTIQSKGAWPAPALEDEISRFPGQCPLCRWSFSHWFSGKGVTECVQLCIGKMIRNVIFIFIKWILSCFMDPNESNHGYRIPFSGFSLEAFQDIMFQHLTD